VGIAAAFINEHTHIATDSAGALWQIRNSILGDTQIYKARHTVFHQMTPPCSQVVPHPSADEAQCRLTSQFWWEAVYSTLYDWSTHLFAINNNINPRNCFTIVDFQSCSSCASSKTPTLWAHWSCSFNQRIESDLYKYQLGVSRVPGELENLWNLEAKWCAKWVLRACIIDCLGSDYLLSLPPPPPLTFGLRTVLKALTDPFRFALKSNLLLRHMFTAFHWCA